MKRSRHKRVFFRKKMIFRTILLLLFFIGAVTIAFWLSHRKPAEITTVLEKTRATLPVIDMKVDDSYINLMHGYTEDMVDRYMRDTVTPLPQNRRLPLRIQEGGDKVQAIRFEIRSLDTTQLVENTELDSASWTTSGEDGNRQIDVTLPIQNLLEKDKEYQLQVILKTSSGKEVTYYTRIVLSDSLKTGDMINFIQSFHDKTMNTAKASGMASYLKTTTDTSGSLGKVTLNSSYKQLLWNYLDPKPVGESRIYLEDINNSIGTFRMDTRVTFTDKNEQQHSCRVKEIFTVQVSNGYWYILNYERTANEILDENSIDLKNGRIDLGIVEDDSVHVLNSSSGNCQAFVVDGELWMNYQASGDDSSTEGTAKEKNLSPSLTQVFSFAQDEPDLRADYAEHDMKLVSVDDEGNVAFILYGYMNSGNHEGEIGLTFYRYNVHSDQLEEIFYLPFDRSYEILKQEIGRLAYVNRSDLFYLMLNGKIYAIDFAGKEYMTVVENVSDDALVINAESNVIAWEEDRSGAGAARIQILYLDDGHQNTVRADSQEYLRAAGFVGEDLMVGKIRKTDYESYRSSTSTPMYALEVINAKGDTAASYQKDNILITDTVLQNNGVILKRARIGSTGLMATSDDALIENVNQTTAEEQLLVTGNSDEGYRKWYLSVGATGDTESLRKVGKISVSDSSYLKISLSKVAEDGMFFAYSKGRLQGICSSIAEAVDLVYDDVGYVTDSSGHYVMRRGYRGYSMLGISGDGGASTKQERKERCMQKFSSYEEGSYAESFADLEAENLSDAQMLQRGTNAIVYDLTGCSLSQIGYFYIGQNHPIYAMTTEGAVLITGIGSENVYIWNPVTGSTTGVTLESAENLFKAAGNVFISCMEP